MGYLGIDDRGIEFESYASGGRVKGITFDDGTFQSTAPSAGSAGSTSSVGFIIDGNGSPITTGDKLDALKQIPYAGSILSSSAYVQDGVSGTANEITIAVKKVSSLADTTTNVGTSGVTLGIGITASTDQFGITFTGLAGASKYFTELSDNTNTVGSTVGANEWLFPHIIGNSGDITKIQLFLTIQP